MGQHISLDAGLSDGSALAPPLVRGGQRVGLTVERVAKTVYLRFTGDFDLACVGQVEAALERVSQARATRVVFDLERVRFIDLAGLGTILRANDRARSGTFEVVVVRPRGLAKPGLHAYPRRQATDAGRPGLADLDPRPSKGWSA